MCHKTRNIFNYFCDIRSLFTANERIKTEYCNLQTDYKTLKTENNQMKLRTTEMQGELNLVFKFFARV